MPRQGMDGEIMGNAVRGRVGVQGGGVGSHSTEKGKPRCPKSFQCLILLCSSLHPQTRHFLPYLLPFPTILQPTGLCKEEDLSLSGLFHLLLLVASPVMPPLAPALPLGTASPRRARGAVGMTRVLSLLLFCKTTCCLWGLFCGLREQQLFLLATGHPVQELAPEAGQLHFHSRNSLPEPRQPLGQHFPHSMASKVQATLGEVVFQKDQPLGTLLPTHCQPQCWALPALNCCVHPCCFGRITVKNHSSPG